MNESNKGHRHPAHYEISGPEGMQLQVLDFGARIKSIKLPAEQGLVQVCLSYADNRSYLTDKFFLGATVGRYANRINAGRFTIDGQSIHLQKNEGDNHLHGGAIGFANRYWQLLEKSESRLLLGLVSEDGDQGYPGNLNVSAEFCLEPRMGLRISYKAHTDMASAVNIASHIYFNLNGAGSGNNATATTIVNHQLRLNAEHFTAVDEQMIPSGELLAVADTPFDFRHGKLLQESMHLAEGQLQPSKGFDHNFVFDKDPGKFDLAGELRSPRSGIAMKLYTNQPGAQLYTGNFLQTPFRAYQGLCLETQNFPDAPNHSHFPNAILRPGDTYLSQTRYAFSQEHQG